MTPCLTIAGLNKFRPCPDAGRRVRAALRKLSADKGHCFTAAEAKAAGCTYDDVIWAASSLAMNDEAMARRLTYYVNDCAIKVLPIFEKRWPDDDRPRLAIRATLDFLAGKISKEEWGKIARAARDARDARAARAAWDARAAWAAWVAWAAWAARDARDARAARAAWAAWAAWAARAARAAWTAWAAWDAWDAEAKKFEGWQFDRLIIWLGADEPKPLRLPAKQKVKS